MEMDPESDVIRELESEIARVEYERAKKDIDTYLLVSKSLDGLLEYEKAAKHLHDFVMEERCEENYLFMMEVKSFKNMHTDTNYTIKQKIRKASGIVEMFLKKEAVCQLYIPLPMIQAFLEEFKQWDVEMDNPTEANIPPITIFDGLVKEVLETVRRTSYQKFIRLPNLDRKLAMTVQDISIAKKSENARATSVPVHPTIEL